jgi:RNA polymerase sigma-70 factor, ECF subfamily
MIFGQVWVGMINSPGRGPTPHRFCNAFDRRAGMAEVIVLKEVAIGPNAGDPDFDAWVMAAQSGDANVLGRLLEAFRPYLLAAANQSMPPALKGKFGGSDLVQETLVKAHGDFRGLHFDGPADLRAWLRTVLRNNLADSVRRYCSTSKRSIGRERAQIRQGRPSLAAIASRDPTPCTRAICREQITAVDDAIEHLPCDEREVVLLRHREGLHFDEIGRRMSRSGEAARKLWARAILRVQRMLEASEP